MSGFESLVVIAAYLVGSFPTGVVLSRLQFGVDVRGLGSGNTGATNLLRSFGWRAGTVTFLVDFFKGFVFLYLVNVLSGDLPWLVTLTALSLVVGHCFSLFLKFRGGKGVSTTLGCLLAVYPPAGAMMVGGYIVGLSLTRISAVGSLLGVFLAVLYTISFPPDLSLEVLVFALAALVTARHYSNLRHLFAFYRRKRSPSLNNRF